MNLKEIYDQKKLVVSFEIFPPKDDISGEKTEALYAEIEKLKAFKPSLISLTYGAGGVNRSLSIDIVKRLKADKALNVMPHFTCVCSARKDIKDHLKTIEALGIENILALRGDMPQDIDVCSLDFRHASDLVEYIKSVTELSIGVAGYPEGHIEAESFEKDIEYLKKKVDLGASVIYTQLFFKNEKFFSYFEKVRAAGIKVPVVAGIMPVISYRQLEKMLTLARVAVPKSFLERLEKFKDNSADVKKIGVEFAAEQCQELADAGVCGLHFYTLNKAYSTNEVLKSIQKYLQN